MATKKKEKTTAKARKIHFLVSVAGHKGQAVPLSWNKKKCEKFTVALLMAWANKTVERREIGILPNIPAEQNVRIPTDAKVTVNGKDASLETEIMDKDFIYFSRDVTFG